MSEFLIGKVWASAEKIPWSLHVFALKGESFWWLQRDFVGFGIAFSGKFAGTFDFDKSGIAVACFTPFPAVQAIFAFCMCKL